MSHYKRSNENVKQKKEKKQLRLNSKEKKKNLTVFYSTVVSIFDCFRFDEFFDTEFDLRFSLVGDEETFLFERDFSIPLSCCVVFVSVDVESSLIVIEGDVWINDDFSDKASADCWTRPRELNNCFSLPDDVAVFNSSRNTEVLVGKVDGEGLDFLVAVGEDGNGWWEMEFGLSRS